MLQDTEKAFWLGRKIAAGLMWLLSSYAAWRFLISGGKTPEAALEVIFFLPIGVLLFWPLRQALTIIAGLLTLLGIVLQLSAAFTKGDLRSLLTATFYGIILTLFIIRRPPKQAVERVDHFLIALGGTFLPMAAPLLVYLLQLPVVSLAATPWPLLIQFFGLGVTLVAILSLGRSFGVIAANREIKTDWLYRLVRHPLYLGESVFFLGLILTMLNWATLAVFCLQFTCQLLRIREEEALLSQDPTYADYMRRVRFRLIPGLY